MNQSGSFADSATVSSAEVLTKVELQDADAMIWTRAGELNFSSLYGAEIKPYCLAFE